MCVRHFLQRFRQQIGSIYRQIGSAAFLAVHYIDKKCILIP